MRYLSLCCIVKDEDPFLKEWVAYHSLLGVEHFYIYDNMSHKPVREALGSFADSSRITIRRVPGNAMQLPVYKDCLDSFRHASRWIGFIDLDEFALPLNSNDLRVTLAEFEPYAAIAVTWHLFNSAGHITRPQLPVTEAYTEAFAGQTSYHLKCFVDPMRTVAAFNPHSFQYETGEMCVNEDHYPCPPAKQDSFAKGRKIRINHYFTRSQQDFAEKIARGRATNDDAESWYQWVMFYDSLAKPCVTDTLIQKFLPSLKQSLERDIIPNSVIESGNTATADCSVLDASNTNAKLRFNALERVVIQLVDAGELERAESYLCHANIREFAQNAEFWALRARIARLNASPVRAEVFMREGMKIQASASFAKAWGSILN